MPTACILTGHGRYADPWHPFAETSAALAEIAGGAGLQPWIVTDVDAALAALREDPLPDLVIANLGPPDEPEDARLAEEALDGLDRVLADVPVLAVHAAANSFWDSPAWERRIGGRWLPQVSWHPPFGTTTVHRAAKHPGITDGLESFTLEDERYLDLRRADDNHVLYTHRDDEGEPAPTVWLRESDGPRSAYDALGHDLLSYDSAEHRQLLERLMRWLIRAA